MKKVASLLAFVIITGSAAQAQPDFSDLRIDVGGNYTMYKGDLQKSTPGAKVRIAVPFSEKLAAGLGFTYGFPIKQPSEVALSGGGSVPSEFQLNFKTISLDVDYFFGGEKEEGLTVYASARMGLVLASVKEKIKGTIPPGEEPMDQSEKVNENGFTIGLGLGSQFALSSMKLFADAGIALPANQVNGQYVYNSIPAHFIFNVGVRFSLGGGDY